ncbi:MAG: DUF721 domain-containing protein [Treponema sp.]|jgi:hypothetical protein|nr:DUF721 domain-containing protein [Treponema sp.]
MKKAGELLSFFFDDKTRDRAQGYSDIFASWASVVSTQKISAAAAHSWVVECERHILLIEADHPGWIQLLQTKQRGLLRELQSRFPEITGISFRLSRKPRPAVQYAAPEPPSEEAEPPGAITENPLPEPKSSLYDTFEDTELQAILRHLYQGIMARTKIP